MVDFSHAKHVIADNGAVTVALLMRLDVTSEIANLHDDLPPDGRFVLVVYNERREEVVNLREFDDFAAADTAFVQDAGNEANADDVSRHTVG